MDSMNIQWYPGHMTKTRRQMEQDLKLVDAVCELLDARIPISSRNPDIAALCGPKPRLVILNRMDMADPAATRAWCEAFRRESLAAVATDCKSRRGLTAFVPAVRNLLQEKITRNAAKGQNRPLKIMVVGIPNVGKSTFINQISGRKGAKAENRPGVTRGKQWVTVDESLLLLDTPGILWPKFEDPEVGLHLAYTGAVKDDILDAEDAGGPPHGAALGPVSPGPGATGISWRRCRRTRGATPFWRQQAGSGASCWPEERLTQSAWPGCCWRNSGAASWAGLLLRCRRNPYESSGFVGL